MKFKHVLASSLMALCCLAASTAQAAISDGVVKIGILTDMTGPYSALSGTGSVVAVKMAVEDCLKAECKGMKIEVLAADHQNKADISSAKAREWMDKDHVDVLVDMPNSSVALAIQKLIKEKGGIALFSGSATSALTNEECTENGFQWMFDTYSLASGTAGALTRMGYNSWYFLTVDYAYGHALEADARAVINSLGGTTVGGIKHPLNTSDFSSFLLQAQNSKAKVIGLALAGQDLVTAIKQASEFGIGKTSDQRLASLLVFISDVHSLGLQLAQGLTLTEGFYWDQDNAAREFSARFGKLHKGNKPTMTQAGGYSSTYHYLKVVAAAKSDDWKVVAKKMREIPIKDQVMVNASIRPDGRVIHDMTLYQVKTPAESKGEWDYYKKLATIPAAQAFRPLEKSNCPLLKKK